MARSWSSALSAWLHDPPDKCFDILGHETRAAGYAKTAMERPVSRKELEIDADSLASATERTPMPDGRDSSRRVEPDDGLLFRHPLTASQERRIMSREINPEAIEADIRAIVAELPGAEQSTRFLALWRLLPERLTRRDAEYAFLPADTRTPDHTIWQHLDMTAALEACDWGNNAAFLSFSLGPVQSFIEAARSLRDLWSGSMILSWLTFRACGP